MGNTVCCETFQKEKSEVDLSVGRRAASDQRSKSVNYMYSKSLSRGSKELNSKRNLQIKLKEIGLDAQGSHAHLELVPVNSKSRSNIVSGPELYHPHSSNEFSNSAFPSPQHQTNYIVVVEADAEKLRKDSDDGEQSKSRSYCRSIEKSIEEKVLGARHNASYLGGIDAQFKNSDGHLSNSVVVNKPEKSIMQSKYNIEDLPSGRTIEQTLAGKTKDTLIVSAIEDLQNIDKFSDTKFVKSYIHLKSFSDAMVKKFINATSVLSAQYTEVVIAL